MANKLEVTTPSDCEIVMTRTFDAPRRLVWEAMTKPEWIRRWIFAPPGWTMTVCEGDSHVDGGFRWAWQGPDNKQSLAIWGVNREVVPPERISHTENMQIGDGECLGEMLATIVLTEIDNQTYLRLTMRFDSRQARDGALASGMEHGVAVGYERLDALLAENELTPA